MCVFLQPASNQKSVPSFAANKPIAVSLEQQRAQKNEIFVDLLERLTVLIGADVRYIMHCLHGLSMWPNY